MLWSQAKVALTSRCVKIYDLHGAKFIKVQENLTINIPALNLGHRESLKPWRVPQNTGPTKKMSPHHPHT